MNQLQQAIARTIVYFDIFDYPLTIVELWKWLYQPDRSYSLNEVQEALDNLTDKIQTHDGFYFLPGKSRTVEQRLERYALAEAKFRRAMRFIRIFRFIPFIKMIAVCNSLAYSNSDPAGDIDFFIIVKKNRLWLTRFFSVGLLKILGVRPKAQNKQDTIDTNFFVAEDGLNIANLQITIGDPYLAYWVNQLVPIFDVDGTYQKFQLANHWVKRILPNSFNYELNDRRQVNLTWPVKLVRFLLALLLVYDFNESWQKKIQLKIMPPDLKQMMNQDTRVVVNNQVLKFHRQDRREEYLKKFKQSLI
ncbi:MAG: hypothetical protein Q8P32_01310 [Candidatus Komeilibacteria bacterium]|nr:hypothetical protein [Candidatus Komeilibacteria bacterium]